MDRARAGACLRGPQREQGEPSGKAFRRADDWPLDRFAVIERAWSGATVVCIAGGDVTPSDVARVAAWRQGALESRKVIAVNDAYLLAPFADVLYYADARWFGWHHQRNEFKGFAGEIVTIEGSESCGDTAPEVHAERRAAIDAGRHWWLHASGAVLSMRHNELAKGQNSGYQAVELARLLGAARVVLLGYSMKRVAGGLHWFGDHPVKTPEGIHSAMLNNFRALVSVLPRGFEVVNATRDTALDCFPKRDLESVLSDPPRAALPA